MFLTHAHGCYCLVFPTEFVAPPHKQTTDNNLPPSTVVLWAVATQTLITTTGSHIVATALVTLWTSRREG